MIQAIFRKFGYIKLETPQRPPVGIDKHDIYFRGDIVTLSFRKGEQIIIQTSNEKLLGVINEMTELLESNDNEVSIDTIIDILHVLNIALAIRNVIPE